MGYIIHQMEFLRSITSRDAIKIIETFPVSLNTEIAKIENGLNRIIAEDIISEEDIPPFSRSTVDGYAVKSKDTYGAKETSPIFLSLDGSIKTGENTELSVTEGHSISISTGAMIPDGADGVVMLEYIRPLGDAIEVTRGIHTGENICFKGEDIRKGDLVLKKGKRLTPFDLGILSSLGITQFTVFKTPKVALISSGDEIVPADSIPPVGKIRDINRYTVSNILIREGADVSFLGIAKDSMEEISEKLISAKGFDMILISGGSSKGERDYIVDAIEALGGNILFHGINIKPGKPTIFGRLWDKPIFGLPGHPVSCIMVTIRFVVPLVKKLKGEHEKMDRVPIMGILTTNIPSTYGIEEYVRVSIEMKDGVCYINPVFSKSSVISSLAVSYGYIIIPEAQEGIEQGEIIEVHKF